MASGCCAVYADSACAAASAAASAASSDCAAASAAASCRVNFHCSNSLIFSGKNLFKSIKCSIDFCNNRSISIFLNVFGACNRHSLLVSPRSSHFLYRYMTCSIYITSSKPNASSEEDDNLTLLDS